MQPLLGGEGYETNLHAGQHSSIIKYPKETRQAPGEISFGGKLATRFRAAVQNSKPKINTTSN